MELFRYFVMSAVCLLMLSCKNESKQSTPLEILASDTIVVRQIDFISYNEDPHAIKWYEYNDQGDITREAIDIDTVVYEYSVGRIVKRHIDKTLSWHYATVYFTDQYGRVDSADIYDEKDKKVSSIKYTYNQDGYLINSDYLIHKSGSHSISEFEYKEGNLVKVKIFDIEGKLAAAYLYDYYPDKSNILNLFIENISDDILPNERMGKRNKNLVKQLSNVTHEGDTMSLVKYNYGELVNGILTCVQIDELNEFETKILFHLK
ncbi:MAG: hypothetical protein WBO36_15630 [Saprospiraceae bacterium]